MAAGTGAPDPGEDDVLTVEAVVEIPSGGPEAKVIVAPAGEPEWADIGDLGDLPGHRLAATENFFGVYKMLDEESSASADGRDGADVARRVIAEARQRHEEQEAEAERD